MILITYIEIDGIEHDHVKIDYDYSPAEADVNSHEEVYINSISLKDKTEIICGFKKSELDLLKERIIDENFFQHHATKHYNWIRK